ncbi:MAG TPA: hypothetical protein VFR29_00760 [Steroidobacteraceae bacterium]|nr:hypothetical protein [Steroidobacteraceae bacterium]
MKTPKSAVGDLARAGFDIGLIEANLHLDPEARARRHQAALDLATALSTAGDQLRGQFQQAASDTLRR